MTSFGGGVGYEDWRRVQSNVSDPLEAATIGIDAPSTTIGPFYVAAYPTLTFVFEPTVASGLLEIEFNWFADQGLTIPLSSFTWTTTSDTNVYDAMANRGPWLSITFGNGGHTFGDKVQFFLTGSLSSVPDARPVPTKQLLIQRTVIAVGTTTDPLPFVTTGPAIMSIVTAAVTWSATVEPISPLVSANFCHADQTDGNPFRPFTFYLPEVPCQLSITNGGAASILFNTTITLP